MRAQRYTRTRIQSGRCFQHKRHDELLSIVCYRCRRRCEETSLFFTQSLFRIVRELGVRQGACHPYGK